MDPSDNNNVFNDNSDICEQLLQRYTKSSAPQHRHLIATAAATRSIIQSESLPLTPFSYFAATISTLSNNSQNTLDPQALSALSSFLAIVLPLIKDVSSDKATEAIGVIVAILEKQPLESEGVLGTSTVRAFVKCLGILVGFCDKEDWSSVELGFESLVKFSIDKRPKVRKCAQDCILTVFMSFGSSLVAKKAGKRMYSLIEDNMTLAMKLSAPKEISGPKDEHQEVLHSLNILKPIIPYLPVKVNQKLLAQLVELMSSQSSAFTRHIFDNIGAILDASGVEIILQDADNIIKGLISYISSAENPVDNVLLAASLAKSIIEKIHDGGISVWITYLPLVVGCISGLLTRPENIALQSSNILKELIIAHIDGKKFLTGKKQAVDDEALNISEFAAVKAICLVFEDLLISSSEFPNDHILAVLSVIFLKLGEVLDLCAKGLILKLADWMAVASGGAYDTKNLQVCIGAAVIAMGPEKLLARLPITLNAKDYSVSNTWLIPILNKYVCGSSLGFFIKHMVPLAVSFEQASSKVKKSVIREELQAYARGCWGLLPAFCRSPSDVQKNAQALTTLLIPFLKEESFMLENISAALQELVNKNKSAFASDNFSEDLIVPQKEDENLDLALEFKRKCSYSKKSASKNIKALASCSEEWLQALVNVFFKSSPANYQQFKEAIECLTCISDSSTTQRIFTSTMGRSGIMNDSGEYRKLGFHSDGSTDNEENNTTLLGEVAKRCLVLELGSCFVEGASEDLIKIFFGIAKDVLEATHGAGHLEAYHILNRILEKSSWFRSSHVEQLMDLLASVKPPTDVKSLESRFACYKTLLIDSIQGNLDEENTQAFLILNEIILTLKDSTEEGRKTAYDALIGVCSSLRDSSSVKSNESYKKFIDMIIAYLSGSSPHIKSGAVSALSVLVYSDADICVSVPDLVPSVLTLLQSKDVEVTKAVLGFVKVMVSSIQAKDLHILLSDIVNGVLLWSSVSRHHFRSKVTVIMEILMRKCGVAAVKSIAAEKYKNFIKTVAENRHGKTNSREDGTPETESTPSDSRQRKRKDRESSDSLKEKDSREPYKRKKRKEGGKDSSTKFAKQGVTGGGKRKREMKMKNNTADEPYFSSGSSAGKNLVKRKREFSYHKHEGDKAPLQMRGEGGKFKRGFPGKGKTERQKRPANDVRGSGAEHKRGQNRRQKTNKNS
ncbi:PREDICTED: RRP12-like protein isoform X2 [Nicotiana attenuata]|uniref:Uncharacterized protein n=1 Tax=Nicotiana attenuata TaxID=49451 RepID=A0A1J6L073_NICAT|nr:PREDICTED: RRP12-like protein isoform X2 [Nicotiana attenuata]OIT28315.1 hypothetical protein A4A49_18515 [Nicotiana attenuata]